MPTLDNINPEDFLIQVKPMLNPAKRWTGEVDVSVVSSKENPMNDEDYYGVLEFCRIICASIPMMEKDEDIRTRALDYLKLQDELDNIKNKPKIIDKRDNVIVVSFDKKKK
jgi:hypothetical protein|tara:strand:- start:526 stop:858 length:333 start_codon:yes stop_codon:yes gene_type:complete